MQNLRHNSPTTAKLYLYPQCNKENQEKPIKENPFDMPILENFTPKTKKQKKVNAYHH